MDLNNEQTVLYQVPLLRRPKTTASKPERMSRRTAKFSNLISNPMSPPSNPSTAIPNPRSPANNFAKSTHLDSQTITAFTIHDRKVKSGIDQNDSTILPQAPTNSPTKSPSDQGEGTGIHPLEPRGPAPFFPRNKKLFNTQASLYAQLFSCPSPPSQEHFTLNEFQFFAKHRPSFTFSNTTVIKSYQNYKKLTSWLEAFPPSQAALNTLKLKGEIPLNIFNFYFIISIHFS